MAGYMIWGRDMGIEGDRKFAGKVYKMEISRLENTGIYGMGGERRGKELAIKCWKEMRMREEE